MLTGVFMLPSEHTQLILESILLELKILRLLILALNNLFPSLNLVMKVLNNKFGLMNLLVDSLVLNIFLLVFYRVIRDNVFPLEFFDVFLLFDL
jgi:hypothetical protein